MTDTADICSILIDRIAEKVAELVMAKLAVAAPTAQRLMSLPDTATYLGRSVGAIEQLVKRGVIPVTKIDGKLQVDRIHDLRHSMATLLLVQGVHPKVVQELGGWSDVRIVLNTYSHCIESMKNDAADKMEAILNPLASSLASTPAVAKPN
jgi:integrase